MSKEIKKNHLLWDGCDTVELAKKYGTPLYVVSQTAIEKECRALQEEFIKKYENVHVAYASKAFNSLAMLKIIEKEGLGVDVVSGGELYTAICAQFPPERIEFNGNNKSNEELEQAIDYGVGRLIVDGSQELEKIIEICRKKGKKANILFRITPEVEVETHQFISTGQKDSKFGLPLDESLLLPILQQAIQSPEIDFYGIHFHIGSQLFDNSTHLKAAKVALQLAVMIKEKFNYEIKELNYGGGFGVRYTQNDERKSYAYFLDPLMTLTKDFCAENGLTRPTIAIEPGRSIVAEAGISLHTIGSIKTLPGIRKYAAIDGGMTDNIRPGLYQAAYTGMLANKAAQPVEETVTISGKACESTDILIENIQVPAIMSGDIFATFTTGAYGYAMANNYNKLAIPAVILVNKGDATTIVKRQTYEQIIQNERIPDSLK